ncbi:MAG: pyridoxamine 5'-phosphate oxidase family protein [Candidatus Poseidoniaceae archaeon]|nr:pyridoxamine 5'-phosphate oxidase family protein [Candidatus Poseidoniaceae archaeon]
MADEEDQTEDEIQSAEIAARKDSPESNIANWLQTVHHGTLSTLSTKKGIEGFPIGSIVPFALDEFGRPFILVADIAAHTRNINKSNEVCLFLSDPNSTGDPQSHWRISLVGNMKRVVSSSEIGDISPELLEKSIQISDEEESTCSGSYPENF